MKTNQIFPLADLPNFKECEKFNLNRAGGAFVTSPVKAVWTGEKRCPKKGEWYLSGAIVEAYRAPNDLSSQFHIAKLVKTETKTVTSVVS